jgi:hypothetical protein
MKANELRIGNLVSPTYSVDGHNAKIVRISEGMIGFGGAWPDTEIGSLEPLILTEGWLVKLGFEPRFLPDKPDYETKYYFEHIEHGFLITKEKDLWYPVGLLDGNRLIPYSKGFRYVHQLQNLFYATLFEELTIKP